MHRVYDEDERQLRQNNLFDAEIYRDDLRAEILALLPEYREAKRMVRVARARLEQCDFIDAIAAAFGPEIAQQVQEHVVG